MNRVALVTGGASGIGAATAEALARDGLSVAVADINLKGAEAVARRLAGSGHVALPIDIRDEASIAACFEAAEKALGPVTVLAAIAGGTIATQAYRPTLVDTSAEEWDRTDQLNARGTFLSMREILRRNAGRTVEHGRIVTISSLAGQQPGSPTGVAYSASKAAIIGLARCAAAEAAPMGFTVNTICPGAIDTPAFRTTVSDAQIAMLVPNILLGRMGTPEDIAEMIRFLVTPAASYMTGCIFDINGGRHMA